MLIVFFHGSLSVSGQHVHHQFNFNPVIFVFTVKAVTAPPVFLHPPATPRFHRVLVKVT